LYKSKQIYKITNDKNGKSYIGQSVNPKERFSNHLALRKIENNKLAKDIKKYGKNSFSLTILGDYENYNEMESYFIKKYDTIKYGYNVRMGGEEPPVLMGEDCHFSRFSKQDVNNIISMLEKSEKSIQDIACELKCNYSTIKRINDGESWFDENLKYPIRDSSLVKYKEISKEIKKMILNGDNNLREISEILDVSHSRVKAINTGQNYKEDIYKYPLRKNIDYNKAVSTILLVEE